MESPESVDRSMDRGVLVQRQVLDPRAVPADGAFAAASAHDGPALVDAVVSRMVLSIAPSVTVEMARSAVRILDLIYPRNDITNIVNRDREAGHWATMKRSVALGQPSGRDGDTPDSSRCDRSPTRHVIVRYRAILSLGVAILLLGALYFLFKNSLTEPAPSDPHPRTYRLTIRDQRLVRGPQVLDATQGDPITLIITTDHAGTLHIHGYEKEIVLAPDQETTLAFTAERAGRYGVDFHGADRTHAELAALEVQPR
jgi:hypothetical protein